MVFHIENIDTFFLNQLLKKPGKCSGVLTVKKKVIMDFSQTDYKLNITFNNL